MTTPTLRISRQQLAAFLKNDHDAIRQFETLFSTVANPDTPASATEPEIVVEAAAHEALARIERLERAFQMLEIAPVRTDQIYLSIPHNYSTSEQATTDTWIDGKTIYKKTISCGTLLNNATKSIAHGISDLGQVIPGYPIGVATNTSGTRIPIPFPTPAGATYSISITADSTNISIATGTDRTGFTAYAVIRYTKTN